MTVAAILKRADLLLASPLPHKWACCGYDLGPYCLRCAAARATTELTDAAGLPFYAGEGALRLAVFYIRQAEKVPGETWAPLPAQTRAKARTIVQAGLRLSRRRRP